MIIQPKVRNHFCTTAHPIGCAYNVDQQIKAIKHSEHSIKGHKTVLVIGCSTGYGLSSRIVSAFGSGATTFGVMVERAPNCRRTATAGWYNNKRFEECADEAGLNFVTINADAYAHTTKQQVIEAVKQYGKKIDLLVYSLAAPKRIDEHTGESWQSVLKPLNQPYEGLTANPYTEELKRVSLAPATQEELAATIKVMGGEDWHSWVSELVKQDLLANGFKTVSYSYEGSEVTWPIYGDATIGAAKQDLVLHAESMSSLLEGVNGRAHVGVLKATVTQSSSAIPVFPLYISMLFPIMKRMGLHETDIQHMIRFYSDHLFNEQNHDVVLRTDDLELLPEVQAQIIARWKQLNNGNLSELCDFYDYRRSFLSLFGFGLPNVNYQTSVDPVSGDIVSDAPELESSPL